MKTYIDRISLRREMYAKGITLGKLAEMLCISHQSLIKKMKSRVGFKEDEIATLCGIFGDSIFFDLSCLQNDNMKGGEEL